MLALLLVSFSLWDAGVIYRLALFAQLAFYAAGLVGWLVPESREFGPIRIIYFFLQVNIALAEAVIKLVKGERIYVWKPSQR